MIDYRVKLADYQRSQKVLAEKFLSVAAVAEKTCEETTRSVITNSEQNVAQAVLKSQLRDAHKVRIAALKALGPPPVMPIGYESTGNSHETHIFEPYGCEQELSVASLEKCL